MHFNLTGQLLA